jgi:hypothetical protein
MIVVRKGREGAHGFKDLALAANTAEDCRLLDTLHRDYAQTGVLDITLSDGRRLKSGILDRRRSVRIGLQLPVVISWKAGDEEHREKTVTSNLSRFGCAVKSKKFFLPKTRIRVEYAGKVMAAPTVYSLMDYSQKLVEVGIDFGADVAEFWGVHLADGAALPGKPTECVPLSPIFLAIDNLPASGDPCGSCGTWISTSTQRYWTLCPGLDSRCVAPAA